jgi:hypothetical protein
MKKMIYTIIILITIILVGYIVMTNNSVGGIKAKRSAPHEVPSLVINDTKLEAPISKMGVVVATDFSRKKKKWETKVYDISYNPILEKDVQWDYIRDIVADNDDKNAIIVTESGRQFLLNLEGKVLDASQKILSEEFLIERRKALSIAQEEMLKHYPGGKRGIHGDEKMVLVYVVKHANDPDVWTVKYDVPRTTDSAVEIKLNVKTGLILEFKNSWA